MFLHFVGAVFLFKHITSINYQFSIINFQLLMSLQQNQSIGIFDSGVGGLTIAHAVKIAMPNEKIVYFGDTAHLPYGDKSADSIRYYSEKIAEFLIQQNCKVVLIACNTASAHAFQRVLEVVGSRALVFNVIDPVVDFVNKSKKIRDIGIIGTKGTVSSNVYQNKLKALEKNLNVIAKATPMFVPMIEEGFIYDDISNAIIRAYLSESDFEKIDSLVLACTHYPLIKNQIRKFFNFKVNVIDSSQIVANHVKQFLTDNNLLSNSSDNTNEFYVSDYTKMFETIAQMFFEEDIQLQKIDLWS